MERTAAYCARFVRLTLDGNAFLDLWFHVLERDVQTRQLCRMWEWCAVASWFFDAIRTVDDVVFMTAISEPAPHLVDILGVEADLQRPASEALGL